MDMFRRLEASEIECRVAQVTANGCSLLLYKDARVDQSLLDEVVGPLNWKRSHQLIGDRLYCTVEIRDTITGEWIAKQDVGTESMTEKEKGQASDSFKRACVNWGIGRELYTAPFIWISKDNVSLDERGNNKWSTRDRFKVDSIDYNEAGQITSLAIRNLSKPFYGKVVYTFGTAATSAATQPVAAAQPVSPKQAKPANQLRQTDEAPVQKTDNASSDRRKAPFDDKTKIMIGNCRGYLYGEVKGTAKFGELLGWVVKNDSISYPDEVRNEQYRILREYALSA